ncbi:MAG: hypothetical protein GAK32_00012 [Pseudomonas fluorescens]|nr:MAG: hypothetical protein GAK32_00012 [Pseudomonas fluorescens]
MRVDLDTENAAIEGLPRFQQGMFHARRLRQAGISLTALAVSAWILALFVVLFAPLSIWPVVLINGACALLVLVAGLQSAWWVADWRAMALEAPVQPSPPSEDVTAYERLMARLRSRLLVHVGAPVLWLCGVSLFVLVNLQQFWNLALPGTAMGQAASVGAAIALTLAFALLVLERQLAQESMDQWPEAADLAQLSRVTIICLLVSGICLLFAGETSVWPVRVAVLIGLLPALVALEFLLRGVLSLFSPLQPRVEPRLLAHSFVAGLLRWPPRPLQVLQHELHNRFGIDLRQIWAFTYMRRAFLLVVLAVGWLLTGVHEVGLQARGIYERFGKPVEVFGPGLHVGLPWPLGRVLSVENGVVHELATSVGDTASPEAASAEGPAPLIANQLWDASHVNDKSQVIAGSSGDKQSFQIVNMDVRFVYRIGLNDQAALAATYHSADVPTLIRSTASRILVHEFASRTLDELLGEQRTRLADEIGQAVQADLQALDSGVQAAQIAAQALIARERGAASEQTGAAASQYGAGPGRGDSPRGKCRRPRGRFAF